MPKRKRGQGGLTNTQRTARWRQKGRPPLRTITPEARNDILPPVWVHKASALYKLLTQDLPRCDKTILATVMDHLGMPDNETQISFSSLSDGHESCRAFGPLSPLNVRQQNALKERLATELQKALGLPATAAIEFGSEKQGETWASFIAYDERSKTGKTQMHVDSYSNNPNWLAYTVALRYTQHQTPRTAPKPHTHRTTNSEVEVTNSHTIGTCAGRKYIRVRDHMVVFYTNHVHGGRVQPGGNRIILAGHCRPAAPARPDTKKCIQKESRGVVIGTHPL